MASTEQRSGFRLPWASEPRINAASDGADAGHSEASIEADTTEATVSKDNGTATIDPRSMPWPTPDGANDQATEAAEAASEEATEATAATETPETTEASEAMDPTEAAAPAPISPVKSRRDNPLVAGLVRAMRDAAQTARQDSLTRFAETAKARVEGIHTESAEAAAAIRRQSDQDIIGIRDWSKSEMARVREETEGQIAERRRQVEIEVERHAAGVDHRIKLVEAAVARFESDMDGFFKTLLAEEDPTKLAGYAEQVPEPPTFEDDDLGTWTPEVTLGSGDAAAAEEDFLAGLRDAVVEDTSTEDSETPVASGDGSADESLADDGSGTDAESDLPALDDQDVVDRLAKFTDPASGRDELTTTRLSVVGLVSVASIAGFKRALSRAAGVRTVNVASGPGGDFVFTVQHAAATDFRTLIPELDGFAASITGDADGVLTVSATEPAGTN